MANKIPQSQEELQSQLQEQISFLKSSTKLFDEGNIAEAKRLATTVRVLFHESKTSIPLLKQLNMLGGKFLSTNIPFSPTNLLSHGGLVAIQASHDDVIPVALLDDSPVKQNLSFTDWWSEVVFKDQKKNEFSRKDLIYFLANQDGGAHVDPEIGKKYSDLSRKNSLMWSKVRDNVEESLHHVELVAIRQIAHEVLKSLVPDFSQMPVVQNTVVVGSMIHMDEGIPEHLKLSNHKIKRNDPCFCGSGKKYKKCHGHLL
jgi:hypothetical protein